MDRIKGTVIGIINSQARKGQIVEIKIEKANARLLDWLNKKVLILKIEK